MQVRRIAWVMVSVLSLLLGGLGPAASAASAASDAALHAVARAEAPCHHDAGRGAIVLAAADDECCGGLSALAHCATSCPGVGAAAPFGHPVIAALVSEGHVPSRESPLPRGRTVAPEPPPPTSLR